jgi:hypothetical protein
VEDVRLDNILSKVRGLVAKAEHPDTPENEARLCRERADAMMLKYAIDQATLRESQPVAERARPAKISVDVCPAGSDYERMFIDLVCVVCEHTRTQPVFNCAGIAKHKVAEYNRHSAKTIQVTAQVYGFESDLKYFEILYTTLLLHMSNGIDPSFDTTASDRANAYALHNAGFNWGEIAKMALKFGHPHGWDGHKVLAGETYPGKYWKQQYNMEIRARGESAVSLPAKFTEQARAIWRLNFAQSYNATIRRRLWMARSSREIGAELVLRSSMEEVARLLADEHPHAVQMGPDKEVPFNETAWAAGNRHAKTADLGGQSVASRVAGQLG